MNLLKWEGVLIKAAAERGVRLVRGRAYLSRCAFSKKYDNIVIHLFNKAILIYSIWLFKYEILPNLIKS